MYTLEAVAGDPFSFVEKEGFFFYIRRRKMQFLSKTITRRF